MHKEILEDIGEKELINRLGKFMPKNQTSDDCSLIKTKNQNPYIEVDFLFDNLNDKYHLGIFQMDHDDLSMFFENFPSTDLINSY